MSISIVELSKAEQDKIMVLGEGHFSDLKAKEISPSKLTRTIAALSNAEGGEVYIGIRENKDKGTREWLGFKDVEAANGHIQAFEALFPLGEGYEYTFLNSPEGAGLVLKIDVNKSREVRNASDGIVYVRRGAQNLPYNSEAELTRLRRNKGLVSFETETITADLALLTNSMV